MILLRDLREPAVGLRWHEAVALAMEVAETASTNQPVRIPAIDQLALSPDGLISTPPGGKFADHAAQGFREILGTRSIPPAAPAPLAELVGRAVTPDNETLDGLTGELRYFERPDCRGELAALAARAEAAQSARVAADALGQLQERARTQAEKKKPKTSGEPKTKRRVRLTWQGAVLVIGIGVTAAAATVLWSRPDLRGRLSLAVSSWRNTPSATEIAPEPLPAEALGGKDSRALAKVTPRAATIDGKDAESRSRVSPSDADTPGIASDEVAFESLPADEVPAADVVSEHAAGNDVEPAGGADSFIDGLGPVYSAAHAGVRPPRLLRPTMPTIFRRKPVRTTTPASSTSS